MPAEAAANRTLSTIKWVSYIVIAVSILMLIRALPLGEGVAALRSWVEGLGVWGPIVFGLIYVLAVVAMVPAWVLTVAAGATFGLLVGTITVSLAANIGAALALLIARYLARSRVERFVSERPKFAAIDRAIDEGGWKIVALLRLSPAVPFNVQNYLYGLTSIGFWTCVLTSVVAMLPGTFLYVYLGHAAGSVTAGTGERTPAEWTLLGIGLLATVAVTVYITRLAQRKLREQTAIENGVTAGADSADELDATHGSRPVKSPSWRSVFIPAVLAIVLASFAGVTYVRPELVKRFASQLIPFGPPAVDMAEQYSRRPDGPTVDHSKWNQLLHRHVDADGWVDYGGLQEDETVLNGYLQSLAAAPFEELGRDEKLAVLINAYNAFTVRLVLDHWPLDSIKDIPAADRWDAVRWNVGGNTWSLNQIEHQQIRPNFKEPRIHFALVCAAVGCPPLRSEAFAADRLHEQLEDQTRYVHSHQTWVQYDAEENVLRLTPLYDWYAGDFEQSAGSVLDFVARYRPDVHDWIGQNTLPQPKSLPYDWSINDISNRGPR